MEEGGKKTKDGKKGNVEDKSPAPRSRASVVGASNRTPGTVSGKKSSKRASLVQEVVAPLGKRVRVVSFEGLLVDAVKREGAEPHGHTHIRGPPGGDATLWGAPPSALGGGAGQSA